MTFVNKKGETASPDLVAPDLKQCQAYPNQLGWSFMTLGPRPTPKQCHNKPVCVAVENDRDRYGLIGSMSLCADCTKLFVKHMGKDKAHLNYINPEG